MLAEDRYKCILEILGKDNSVKVSHLMKIFKVSIETVRRDLEYMEKQGLLRRVYGGAVLSKLGSTSKAFSDREKEYTNEKKQIARIAMRYIEEGQSIALDSGTTTLEVARELKNHFQNLTILTNSVLLANELSSSTKYTIILTGGILKSDEFSLVGPIAQEVIGRFHFDKAFVSVSGVSLTGGITDCILEGIDIQRSFLAASDESIILCNSQKFDCISLSKICDIDRVNLIVTDRGLPEPFYKKYSDAGINIVYE